MQPNIALAEQAGLAIQRGIMVDRQMRTSNPDVFAIGDVSEIEGHVSELWTAGAKQAEVAVSAMFGQDAHFTAAKAPVQLKVDGIDVRAFGPMVASGPDQREFVDPEEPDNQHRKLLIERGVIIGATFIGPPGTGRHFASLADPKLDDGAILTRLQAGDWTDFR